MLNNLIWANLVKKKKKNRKSPFSLKIGNQLNLRQFFTNRYQILKNFNPKLPYSDKFGPKIKNDPFSMKTGTQQNLRVLISNTLLNLDPKLAYMGTFG